MIQARVGFWKCGKQTIPVISTTPRKRALLLSAFPELLDYALPAVRLHPRPGVPTPRQSSAGGPLLWPRDEPWPTCMDPHNVHMAKDEQAERLLAGLPISGSHDVVPAEPVAMIPVVQLFRSEAGDLPYPDGTDLLQILWCPNTHLGWRGPRPVAVWRDAAKVGDLLDSAPPCSLITRTGYVPHPCVAHPEPLVEFPPICTIDDLDDGELLGQLPSQLEQRLRRWDAAQPEGEGYFHLAHAPGWKIGGWDGGWPDAAHQETCDCGAPMRPLLEVYGSEELGSVWSPLQEPNFTWGESGRWQDEEPTNVRIGRNAMYWVHTCSVVATHPLTHGLE